MTGTHSGRRTRDRAQTAQDFAVGIGIFVLAVGFVFAFVPTAITPLEAGTSASESAQADRTATIIVGNLSVEDRPNHVEEDDLEDAFDDSDGWFHESDDVRDATGLPFSARVNVTVVNVTSGDVEYSGGDAHDGDQPAAAATRIVRIDGESDKCDPACRVVVRVW